MLKFILLGLILAGFFTSITINVISVRNKATAEQEKVHDTLEEILYSE